MAHINLEDYLENGIHGPKEIKLQEKRKYLGTFRERVIAVLSNSQVCEEEAYQELRDRINRYPEAYMLLNGQIGYEALGKYIKMANACKIPYKMVLNKDYESQFGLVLAGKTAVHIEEIQMRRKVAPLETVEKRKMWSKIMGRLRRLFRL